MNSDDYLDQLDLQKTVEELNRLVRSQQAGLTASTERVVVLEKLLNERQRLLDAIPECVAHGKCVPAALEWIESMKVTRQDPAANKGGLGGDLSKSGLSTAQDRYTDGYAFKESKIRRDDLDAMTKRLTEQYERGAAVDAHVREAQAEAVQIRCCCGKVSEFAGACPHLSVTTQVCQACQGTQWINKLAGGNERCPACRATQSVCPKCNDTEPTYGYCACEESSNI